MKKLAQKRAAFFGADAAERERAVIEKGQTGAVQTGFYGPGF